jgi:hypothetical protein
VIDSRAEGACIYQILAVISFALIFGNLASVSAADLYAAEA